MHVTDYAGNEYIVQALSTNDGDLNGNQSVSVSIKSSKVNDLFINDIDKLWTITDLDNVEHKIIYLNKKGSGDKLNVDIRGIPLFFHKLDNDRIYEAYNEHMTAHLAFTRIFEDTGFTFVLVDSFNAIQWEGFGGGETKLETFKRAINRYGAEFEIVGNIVYLKKLIGNDTNHMYRHRLNASNITQEIDAGDMWTYAKGYADYGDGEGGEDWQNAKLTSEYTSPLASILGVLHAPPIKNGTIKDKNTLDQQLKTLVDESLKISVTADIHDLQKQGYPIAQSQLGDRVFLIDERIGLDDEVRIVNKSITRDWEGRVLDLNLTFGTESITKRHMSNINTAIKDINAVLSGTKKIPFSAYDEAVINATNALQRMQSQLEITNNGSLLAVDKDNPNNVVILNAAGLGVSSDGGSVFRSSITGEGVVAETIVGENIIGVNLMSDNGQGYLHISGASVELNSLGNGRRVEMNTDGIISRNSDGSIRFEVDRYKIRTNALMAYDSNVYLAPRGTVNEVRIVNEADVVGGSGEIEDYRYQDLRARNIIGNGLYANYRKGVTHLELRPAYNNGEVRIYKGDESTSPANIRGAAFYGHVFNINGHIDEVANLYIRPHQEVRFTKSETTDQYVDTRMDGLYAAHVTLNGHINQQNLYVRAFNEIRATAVDSTSRYISMRADGFYGNSLNYNTSVAGENMYIRQSATGSLYITRLGNDNARAAVYASAFNQSSARDLKTNIEPLDNIGLSIVNNLNVVKYNLKEDIKNGIDDKQVGLIAEDSDSVVAADGQAINLYKLTSFNTKAIQEIYQRIIELENQLNEKKN